MADFSKNRELWDDVLYGTPNESITAASKLNNIGEMSDKMLQAFIFFAIFEANESEKAKKRRNKR